MKNPLLPAALFALLACTTPYVSATPAFAQDNAHSSTQDLQRFVAVVHKLEQAPFDPGNRADRAWAIEWLVAAPDVTVSVCLDLLGGVTEDHYSQADELVVQYMLGMAAFIIENPGKANDLDAQQLAGVDSTLNAYRSMRAARPDEQSPALEKLLAMQSSGELPGFVRKAYRQCQTKNGG